MDGFIQVIRLADGRSLVINEEGKLRELPLNVAATALYMVGRAWHDDIVGNALLCEKGELD